MNQPAALLLDEPLGALDVKLRKQMQLELKRIQHELGTTFVYVTHDQDEALSMSDRIAVMNQGVIEQLGTPREVYEHPATPFVADFVGVLNAMDLRVDEVAGEDVVMRVNERERIVVPRPRGDRRGGGIVAARGRPPGAVISRRRRLGERRVAPVGHRRPGRLPRHADPVPRRHGLGKRLIVHGCPTIVVERAEGDQVTLTWMREDAAAAQRLSRSGQPTSAWAPRFASWSATMLRWISLVPSQIRSTRTSRQNRSATFSRM